MSVTLTLHDETFVVEYDFIPGEPMEFHDKNGLGYPGTSDSVEITSIEYKGVDVTSLISNFDLLLEFEEELLKKYD